jgi:hypothetical protein
MQLNRRKFLATEAKPLAGRLRAVGRTPKAECRRQNARTLHSAFFLHPPLMVVLERGIGGMSRLPFRDPANAGRRFIPLLLADCKLPDTLWRYSLSSSPPACCSRHCRILNPACRSLFSYWEKGRG